MRWPQKPSLTENEHDRGADPGGDDTADDQPENLPAVALGNGGDNSLL